ncbi:MAG TPA: DUF6541 family protein [Pedococcus sp.]
MPPATLPADLTGLADTTWVQALPAVVVAALVLFAPGAVALRLLRLSPATALAAGPLVSVTTISLAGVAAAVAGVDWGPLVLLGTVLALWLLAFGVGRLLPAGRPAGTAAGAPAGSPAGSPVGNGDALRLGPLLAGVVPALLLVTLVTTWASGSADAFPQNPDTVFHLSLTRWMVEQGDVSTLHAAGYASESGTGFYPAAFHAVAASVAELTGATVVSSVTATALVAAGLVWPAGVVLLATRVLGTGLPVTVAAGLSSVAFTAFPFWLLGYGVLWPNLLGQALVPAMLAGAAALVLGPGRVQGAVLVVLGLPGLAIAHPNALIAFGLLSLALVIWALLRAAWLVRATPGRAAAAAGSALALVVVAGLAWLAVARVATALRASNPRGPEMDVTTGLLDVLLFAPRQLGYLWVPAVLVLVGCVVVLTRHARHGWLVLGFAAVAVTYFLNVAVDSPTTRLLTWPWYNNSPRLGALVVVPAALLMTAALAFLIDLLARRVLRGRDHAPVVATALVAAAYLLVTLGGNVATHRDVLAAYFAQDTRAAWVTDAELAALEDLGRRLPQDAVVAANPYTGSSYLYLVSGRRLLYPSEKAMRPGDLRLLGRQVDEVGDDAAVCAAARREGVTHVLVGGEPNGAGSTRGATRAYAGFEGVEDSPTFRRVAQASPYTVFEVARCAGS